MLWSLHSDIKVAPKVVPVVRLVLPPQFWPYGDDGIGVELGVGGIVVHLDVVYVHTLCYACTHTHAAVCEYSVRRGL